MFVRQKTGPAASVEAAPEAEREHYGLLIKLIVHEHSVVIAAVALLAYPLSLMTPLWLALGLTGLSLVVCVFFSLYWARANARLAGASRGEIAFNTLVARFVPASLGFFYPCVIMLGAPDVAAPEYAFVLVTVWAVAVVCATSLFAEPRASMALVSASAAPVVVGLLRSGSLVSFCVAGAVVLVSGLAILILRDMARVVRAILHGKVELAHQKALALQAQAAAEQAERDARIVALTDALTGLPNRRSFVEALNARLTDAAAPTPAFALCLVDLDGFKAVNDSHGHPAGDALLVEVAARFRGACGGAGLWRLGGDEFALIVEAMESPQQAHEFAARLRASLSDPIAYDGVSLRVGATCGFALSGAQPAPMVTLLGRADRALYRAKAQARGTACVYEPGDEEATNAGAALELALRRAVSNNALRVAFLARVELSSNEIVGFAATAQWRDPELAAVAPAALAPLAEKLGLIDDIAERVLRQALQAARTWPSRIGIAVSLSPKQLRPDMATRILAQLEASGVAPARLTVEIVSQGELAGAADALARLRGEGVRVALDGFGGGAALAAFREAAFDAIRIDPAFVAGVGCSSRDAALVAAFLQLGSAVGARCVAEGVAREEQRAALMALGCHEAQGPLFSPALSGDQTGAFLSAHAGVESAQAVA